MAQYLDLTGLTYFKSKLLSSALNYDCNITQHDEDSGDSVPQHIQIKSNTEAYQNLDLIATNDEYYYRGQISVNPDQVALKLKDYSYQQDWEQNGQHGEFTFTPTFVHFLMNDNAAEEQGGSQDDTGDYQFGPTGFKLSYDSDYDGSVNIIGSANGLTIGTDSGSFVRIKTRSLQVYSTTAPNSNLARTAATFGNNLLLTGNSYNSYQQDCLLLGYYNIDVGANTSSTKKTHFMRITGAGTSSTRKNIETLDANGNLTISGQFNAYDINVKGGTFTIEGMPGLTDDSDSVKIKRINGVDGGHGIVIFDPNSSYSNGIYIGKYNAADQYTYVGTATAGPYFEPTTPGCGDLMLSNEDGEIALSTIMSHIYTCLRGDTSYITMADRSRKLIKDIKMGDMVLSYDVNKKDYCEAIVLANVKTGMESRFDTYVFENGATIDIYGDEPFIFEASDVLTIGTVQKLYDYHTKGDDRRWVLTHTPGAKARVIRKFSSVVCEEPIGRYMLVTSNGAFFVNGLLKGNMSNFIGNYYKQRHAKLPENLTAIFAEIGHKLAVFDNGLENDHVDATVLKQLEIKWSAVHSAKDFLTATDYKAMKYAEGAMTEEEWLPVKAQRAEMRAVINENEAEITKLRKQLPENLKQPTWVGKAKIWAECEGILNDHLQDFKDFIYTRYPKTEE